MHDLVGASLIRSMLDFDSWLLAGQSGTATVLPCTRNLFWGSVAGGDHSSVMLSDSFTIMMPTSLRNPRKRPLTSDPFNRQVPSTIMAVDEGTEAKLIESLFSELNDCYGLQLDVNPDNSRGGVPAADHGQRRTVTVGASHMTRIQTAMADRGAQVTNLSTPGWTGTKSNLQKVAAFIKDMALTDNDSVVMDLWSNVAYMGTDEYGLPIRSVKCTGDGKYHLMGQLQAAPRTVFSAVLADAAEILESSGCARVVVVAPFARYVSGKCCSNPLHITNFGTDSLSSEMYKAADAADAAIAADTKCESVLVYHMMDTFMGSDSDLSEVTTLAGTSVWRDGDPVHLSDGAYADIAAAILKLVEDSEGQNTAKRPRLASVVPSIPGSSRGGQAPIRPPLWVSGIATRSRPSGGGRRPYGGRGGRSGRGGRRGGGGDGRWAKW
jgi:hypothetical protein